MISPAAPAVKYMQDADLYIQEWLFYLHMVIRIEVFFTLYSSKALFSTKSPDHFWYHNISTV